MKNSILVKVIVYTCIATLVVFGAYAEEDRGEFYPRLTVVVDKEYSGAWSTVICQDKNGNLWSFYDEDNTWDIGDIANLLMWNIDGDTENDEVVEIYWEGYTDNLEMFFQMDGWY